MESSVKLVYKEDFEKNVYSLIELGSSELIEAFESGNSITIKGLVDDEAVLCTDSKTFIVRQVNTSNSILLVSKDCSQVGEVVVHDDLSNTIELLPTLARLGRIDELLSQSEYSGSKNDANIKSSMRLYTWHNLLSVIQASEEELMEGLRKRGAFKHEGFYRFFDKGYLFRLFDSLITNATAQGLDTSKMTLSEAKRCIQEEMNAVEEEQEVIPDNILNASINIFVSEKVDDEFSIIKFEQDKICRFLGEWLLSNPRNKKWELGDFMEVWKTLGQNIYEPKLEYLDGLYVKTEVIKYQRKEHFIYYFSVNELSTDPPLRFAALFAEKPHWTNEEITPFLSDLAPTQKDRDTLLLKFARMHRNGNTVLYASRIK